MSDLTDRIGGAKSSLAFKAPCRVATTANITLSGLQTIDGVTVVAEDRVLVKNQTTASENGIYLARTTAWVRTKDFDGSGDAVKGTRVYVHSGSAESGEYVVTTSDTFVIGTTSLAFGNPSYQLDSDLEELAAGFIQSGSGASTRTWLAKVRETCVTPQDFGAVGDNSTDDSTAFQRAFTAGSAVYVPPGTYYLGNTALTVTNKAFKLFGAGIGTSVLRWNGSSGGISVSQSSSSYHTEISDLSLHQSGAAVGTAIAYDGSGQKSAGVLQNRTSPRLLIENVNIKGTTGVTTDGWDNHISCNNCMHAIVRGVHIAGKYTTLPTIQSTRGIYFYGDGSPVEIEVSNSWVFFAGTACEFVDCEGAFVHNCNFVAVTKGVYFNPAAGEPQLNVSDSHISAFEYCIDANNLAQGNISGNLFYNRSEAASTTQIRLASLCTSNIIESNTFQKTGSTTVTAISIGSGASSCANNIIRDNIFNGAVDNGVVLGASSTSTHITGNRYAEAGTTQLTDSGTGTTRTHDDHNGTAALPSWTWTGDGDTGIYHPGTNSIGFATAGVLRASISAGFGLAIGAEASTEATNIELGTGRSGDGNAYIDLVGDTTYTDYGARLIRAPTDTGNTSLVHRGTGSLVLHAQDGGSIVLSTSSTNRVTLTASNLTPSSNDGAALGTGSLKWSDLFLASGALVDFNNGAAGFTHSVGSGTSDILTGTTKGGIFANISTGVNILRWADRVAIGDATLVTGIQAPTYGTQGWLGVAFSDYLTRGTNLIVSHKYGGIAGCFASSNGDRYTAEYSGVTAWAALTAYSIGDRVGRQGRMYQATVAGTSSSTAPSHTSGTAVDGTVTWQWLNHTYLTPIGLAALGESDMDDGTGTWVTYIEGVRQSTGGWTVGSEIAIKNKGSDVITNAYTYNPAGATHGLWFAAGSDDSYGGAPANPSATAITIGPNSSTWNKGIVFANGGLTNHGTTNASRVALEFAYDQALQWVDSNGDRVAFITAQYTAGNDSVGLKFVSNALNFIDNGSDATAAQIARVASSVNYPVLTPSITAEPVVFSAAGSDTNIAVRVNAKGTGTISFLSSSVPQFHITSTASAVNNIRITGGTTGNGASITTGGSDTNVDMILSTQNAGLIKFADSAVPNASDGAALGTSSLMWSDLFLASGAVVNWNNGANTLTHSANGLRFDGTTPCVSMGVAPVTSNKLLVRSDTNDLTGISATVQFQRYARLAEGHSNPKCLRAYTLVEAANDQTEWAISGEVDNYSTTAGSTGTTAVSGTHWKYGTMGGGFAGHFNSVEMFTRAIDTDVTGHNTVEIDTNGHGADHPTVNDGFGNRWALSLMARSTEALASAFPSWAATTAYVAGNQVKAVATSQVAGTDIFYYICTVAGTSAGVEPTWPTTLYQTVVDGTVTWECRKGVEGGTGLMVRNNSGASTWGYWRYGIVVTEDPTGVNLNTIDTAIKVAANGSYGIDLDGTFTTAAINIAAGNTVKIGGVTGTEASGTVALSTATAASTPPMRFINTVDNALVRAARFEGDRATPAANDSGYISFMLSNSAGTQFEMARMAWAATDVTASSEDSFLSWATTSGGTLATELVLTNEFLRPNANDGLQLGAATVSWADLFLASGAVTNYANGDYTVTHSTGKLTLATDDATTNAHTNVLKLSHTTSGTPATSIGVGLEFEVETADGNNEVIADIVATATDVGAGTEDGVLRFRLMLNGAAVSEQMRINSSGVLTLGGSNNITGILGTQARAQCHVAGATGGFSSSAWVNDATTRHAVTLQKSRGGSVATYTIVQDGDDLGDFGWMGADGSAFQPAASIRAEVDGTPGAGDMPGRILFSTTADGASTVTERMRITAAGAVQVNSSTGTLGYGTGAGGTATQATDKATGVTIDRGSGQITMNNAALAATTTVAFTLTNARIAATDTVIVNHGSAGTAGSYQVWATTIAAGSCVIQVRNITGGSLSEAIVLNFAVIKGASA
jgi:hypothetical protein